MGQRFMACTNRKSLKYLLERKTTTQNQQNWLAKLLGSEFDIVYKSGVTNKVTDVLSQSFEEEEIGAEINVISKPYW